MLGTKELVPDQEQGRKVEWKPDEKRKEKTSGPSLNAEPGPPLPDGPPK